MNKKIALVSVFIYIRLLASSGEQQSCQPCNPENCVPPSGCLAGLVKDSCDCCYECGRKEGERCDHESLNETGFGTCGENLDCRLRTDLDPKDSKEATCFCSRNYPLCGSDGRTYDNLCHLTEERYRRRDGLRAVSREPCRSAPEIAVHPINAHNITGGYVALACDATGWPVPDISWEGDPSYYGSQRLPGNDSTIHVQSHIGPGLTERTSWLLFTRLTQTQAGIYSCIARNDQGEVRTSATVSVIR